MLLGVESQDIANCFECSAYFDGVSGHREHFASKHTKKLVSSRILDVFYCAQHPSSTIWFAMSWDFFEIK